MGDPFLDDASRPRARYVAGMVGVGVAVVLVVGLVGIFTVGNNQRSAREVKVRSASEQLAARLLAPGDLPSGWTLFGSTTDAGVGSDGFGGSASIVPGCLSGSVDSQRSAEAEEQLVMGTSPPPSINEALATFAGGDAAGAFAALQREMNGCQRVIVAGPTGSADPAAAAPRAGSSGSGGGKVTITTVAPPPLGDQTAGWAITLPTQGRTEATAVVAVRRGSTLVLIAYGSEGAPDVNQAVAFTRTALTKLGL